MPFDISSLASAIGSSPLNEQTSSASIVELDENDNPTGVAHRLQYFPDSISDAKGVTWNPRDVPGGSLPIYQWMSSGERTISFMSIFTTDIDFSEEGRGPLSVAVKEALKASGNDARNVDIRAAILWLRRFMLPRYGDQVQTGATLVKAPRKLQLHLPGTGIGLVGGYQSVGSGRDWLTCIMTNCEVTWVAFFPSGFPRIAEVSLAFAQVAQVGGGVYFPHNTDALDAVTTVGGQNVFAYNLLGVSKSK